MILVSRQIEDCASVPLILRASKMTQNQYAPPDAVAPTSNDIEDAGSPSKPMIPAAIGLFAFGSSSPYALVLCIEHYLDPRLRPIPWSTHFATVLGAIGSIGWFGLNLVYASQAIDLLAGNPTSMSAQSGLATLVFCVWATWRFREYLRGSSQC